jgi:hypothetical protein
MVAKKDRRKDSDSPAPIMGGNAAPPLIAATRKLPPRFVCLPNPLILIEKMVAKQQLSKTNTMINMATLAVPFVTMQMIENTVHMNK